MEQKLLTRAEASAYLKEAHGVTRSPGTLSQLAIHGGGPTYCRIGWPTLYAPKDLDDWVASISTGPLRSTKDQTTGTKTTPRLKEVRLFPRKISTIKERLNKLQVR